MITKDVIEDIFGNYFTLDRLVDPKGGFRRLWSGALLLYNLLEGDTDTTRELCQHFQRIVVLCGGCIVEFCSSQ